MKHLKGKLMRWHQKKGRKNEGAAVLAAMAGASDEKAHEMLQGVHVHVNVEEVGGGGL